MPDSITLIANTHRQFNNGDVIISGVVKTTSFGCKVTKYYSKILIKHILRIVESRTYCRAIGYCITRKVDRTDLLSDRIIE